MLIAQNRARSLNTVTTITINHDTRVDSSIECEPSHFNL